MSEGYWKYLSKRKEAGDDEQKLLPVESLGLVMISHGEEFGEQSAYGTTAPFSDHILVLGLESDHHPAFAGQSLYKFGRAHVKIAGIQEKYSETLKETYLAALEESRDEMKEYYAVRKKLKSRRSAYLRGLCYEG